MQSKEHMPYPKLRFDTSQLLILLGCPLFSQPLESCVLNRHPMKSALHRSFTCLYYSYCYMSPTLGLPRQPFCLLGILYEDDKQEEMANFCSQRSCCGQPVTDSCWEAGQGIFTYVYYLEYSLLLPTLTIVINGRARIPTLPMQMSQSHVCMQSYDMIII